MTDKEYEKIAEYCKLNWQPQCMQIMKTADEVCNNTFIFEMPWDMERTITPVNFRDKIDWYATAGGDKEFLFQLNRHRFLIILGQAFRLTGNQKYAKHFVRLFNDWIDNAPYQKTGDNPWRSLEVGLRGEYWTKAVRYFENTSVWTDELKNKYAASLKLHSKTLRECHNAYHSCGNWGVIQDHGLFAIALELENEEDAQTALLRLGEEVDLQLMSDGAHWEQSALYHNEVLNCILDVIIRCKQKNVEVPKKLMQAAKKMLLVDLKWIKPNAHQPLFGDSDDTDIRDIMTLGAYLFEEPVFKFRGYEMLDFESSWLLGVSAMEKYSKIPASMPSFLDVSLEDSGTHILRSGWEENANYLCMHNGYTGGGHCHSDKLHFDLSIKGKDVFVDGGRYTYVWNKRRKYLKDAKGHNAVMVDGRSSVISQGWAHRKKAFSTKRNLIEMDKYATLGGGHIGFCGVYTDREILWIKPDIYIIIDSFQTNGIHKYTELFHFAPDIAPTVKNNTVSFNGNGINGSLHIFAKGVKLVCKKSMYSPHYNSIMQNTVMKASFFGVRNSSAISVIYGKEENDCEAIAVKHLPVYNATNNIKLLSTSAEGLEIKTKDKTYTVVVSYSESSAPMLCAGKIFKGKLAIADGEEVQILHW